LVFVFVELTLATVSGAFGSPTHPAGAADTSSILDEVKELVETMSRWGCMFAHSVPRTHVEFSCDTLSLKAPGLNPWKLKCDILVSKIYFFKMGKLVAATPRYSSSIDDEIGDVGGAAGAGAGAGAGARAAKNTVAGVEAAAAAAGIDTSNLNDQVAAAFLQAVVGGCTAVESS
jgi:hypothetical protein